MAPAGAAEEAEREELAEGLPQLNALVRHSLVITGMPAPPCDNVNV